LSVGWLPLHPENISPLGILGALAVVFGSIVIALGSRLK
jgi:hypothetical protein